MERFAASLPPISYHLSRRVDLPSLELLFLQPGRPKEVEVPPQDRPLHWMGEPRGCRRHASLTARSLCVMRYPCPATSAPEAIRKLRR